MKNFYKVSNTIENGPRMDRKRTVDGPIKDRVKSRISPINHRLWTVIAPMLFVAFGLFGVNESAWGYTTTMTSNGLGKDGPTSKTENNVTFTIGGDFDSNITSDYYFIKSGKTGNISWSSTGYYVKVTGVSIHAKNGVYMKNPWTYPAGTGYIHTSLKSTNKKVCNSTDYNDYSYNTTNNNDYFGTEGLGDDGKIYFYAEKAEFQIKSLTFTYTTTAKSYTISLNDNGGAGGDGTHNVTYNTATGSLTKTPTKKGYHFTGYYLGEGGTGTKVFNADKTPVQNVEGYTDNSNNKLWKHDGDVTLYAGWEANTYTVHFDGNHASGGSTADQGFSYNEAAKALRANGYTYAYTITYDANGGSCSPTTENTNASCTFDSWNTNPNGTGTKYTNQEPVQNLTDVNNGTVNLYARWTGGATLPSASYTGKKLVGWYDGETFVGTAGQTYQPTANVTLTAHWQDKLTPQFTFAGQALQLGGTYTSFSFSNTTTATPSSSTSDKFHYIITEQTVEGNAAGTPNPGKVITFDGTTITAVNKGTAKIKFVQLEDTENDIIAKESEEYTFTVTKFTPEFTWTPQTYYFNKTYANIFSSNNHDTEISCSTTNSGAAEMVDGSNSYQKTLKTYNDASATITISQAENYYWEPKTVNNYAVSNSKASNHVAFTINNSAVRESLYKGKSSNGTISCSDDGLLQLTQGGPAWTANALYYTIELSGIPDKISFIYRQTMSIATAIGPTGKAFVIYESPTGADNTWNEVWSSNGVKGDDDNHDVDPQSLSASTRFIKFYFDATYTGQYKNITVTELQYFRRQGENTALDFATNVKDHVPAVQSFVVEHANAGYQTSVTAPSHYQVSLDNVNFASEVVYSTNATALTGGDKMGTFTVYVKYLADAIGTHNANVTVHNNLRTDFNVPVTGTTKDKIATQIEYCGASSYSVDAANIASTTLFRVRDTDNDTIVTGVGISLSCEENEQFSIAGGNALDPECGGTNNVKPSFAGNDTYAAATNNNANFAITIARLADEISFENGKAVLVTGDEFDLEGWASALSGTDITYTTASTTVISVEDGKVKAIGKGTATLTATSAGDCTYNSGIAKLTIKVRNASDPCETALLYKSSKHNINLYSGTQTYTIKEGPQDKLTFKVWKTSSVATYSADVKILDNTDNVLHTYTYSVGDLSTTEPETPNVEIDITQYPTARKISISGSGTLYKYISELRVSQKAYLTASTSSVTMSSVKACVQATGQFDVSYSDISRIQLSQTNDDFTYEVWRGDTKLDGFDNDCGEYGTYTVKFFYTPQAKGDYSNTVTLSASGKSQTITLSGTAAAPDREIVWDIPAGNEIVATQSVDLTAYAKTACADSPAGSVYYTWSSIPEIDGAATIEGTTVTFHKEATVTVTAHTVSSDDYNDAATVDKVWTVKKVGVDLLEIPTITSTITVGDDWRNITHDGQCTAVSALDHNIVIAGTVDYTGKDVFNSAGQTSIKFTFTPNSDFFDTYKTFQFDVPVDVQHIASNATPSAEAITYGEAIGSSTLSNSGTTAGTWTWNTENNDAVLDAGQHTLNVHFTPENSNYSELDATVTLKVNKATTSLNWTNAPENLAYNATGVTYTASSASDGAITYSIIAGGAYAHIDSESGVLTIDEPGHQITIQASQVASTNYNAASPIAVDVTIAAAPAAPTFTNATNNNDWQTAGNWSNGEVPSGENPDVIISGELIVNEDVTVGGLTILPTGSVAVVTNGTLTIKGTSESRSEYGDMHVADDGNVVLGNSADLKVRHFFLDAKLGDSSNQAASGQVKGNGALNVIGDAYFQMKFDPSGAITYGWYDFVVPFEVNTSDGIYRVEANDDLTPMTSGVDFLVQSFSEARCAAGQKAWTNFSGTMMPGQGYTITFNYQPSFNQNTFLFKKKAGATIGGSNTYSAVRTFSGEESEQGWNVLGNGTLQHIELAENLKIQIFEHASNSYQPFVATEKTIAVGTSFQVQVFDAQKTIVMSTATDRPILAPKREVREVEEFRLSLTAEGEEKEADRLWISASEEATGAYWIGHDLLKKGTMTGAKVARMWCTRNGKQLCDVEMPMVNGSAENALGLFTPNAGQYTLAIEEAPADASLYLTYNGAIIWDLTASPYVFDLTKGTTEGYGLRIEAANAPQVTTGVENGGLMNDANSVRKVIIDNKMYIITPEGAIFDVIGKKVQ